MNKTLLNQALKFKYSLPSNSQIIMLSSSILEYQKENEIYFFTYKHGKKPEIVDKTAFFNFLSEINDLDIKNFEDIEILLKESTSRKESIEKTGDSKEYYSKVFDKVIVFQKEDTSPILYKNIKDIPIINDKPVLVVENGETFLNIYNIMTKFGFSQFLYLSGFPNSLTKEFLKDKDTVFFLDYDIEAIRIYDSVQCKHKEFFNHPDIEEYFSNKKILNKKLYLKQRKYLPKEHTELQWLINLIQKNSGVIEQEIFN